MDYRKFKAPYLRHAPLGLAGKESLHGVGICEHELQNEPPG